MFYKSHECYSNRPGGCRGSSTHHTSMDSLKKKVTQEWDKIPQRIIRDFCITIAMRLQQVVDAKGFDIE